MVEPSSIKGLIEIEDVEERNTKLRKTFSAFTCPIDVSGVEKTVLIILLNLTFPKSDKIDLLDKKNAKKTLRDKKHITECINQVAWLHSHNLKYPDARVSKQRIIAKSFPATENTLSSANSVNTLGWSYDSGKVNYAKLFCANFSWHGDIGCLAQFILSQPEEWKVAFQSLGFKVYEFKPLVEQIANLYSEEAFPDVVDLYSVKLRFPYKDDYLCITPVVSHSLQSALQQAAYSKKIKFSDIYHEHPAAISELCASQGGHTKVLSYPLQLWRKSHRNFGESKKKESIKGKSAFNDNALLHSAFIRALNSLINLHTNLSYQQRKLAKASAYKVIRRALAWWVAPIIEWRASIEEGSSNVDASYCELPTIVCCLLLNPIDEFESLVGELLEQLFLSFSKFESLNLFYFEPKLLSPLEHSLRYVLKNWRESESSIEEEPFETPQCFILLQGIRVDECSSMSSMYTEGLPSLMAVWGMMHKFQITLNKLLGTNLVFTSFAWFIERYVQTSNIPTPEFRKPMKKSHVIKRAGLIAKPSCDMDFNLVIRAVGYNEELELLNENIPLLEAAFPATLARGKMYPTPTHEFSNNVWCQVFDNQYEVFNLISRYPSSGRWVVPCKEPFKTHDEFYSILQNNNFYLPSLIGYQLLERPIERKQSLCRHHAYAEAVLGIIDTRSAVEIRLGGIDKFFKEALWKLEIKEQIYLLKADMR